MDRSRAKSSREIRVASCRTLANYLPAEAKFMGEPNMMGWRKHFGIIEAKCHHVDFIRMIVVVIVSGVPQAPQKLRVTCGEE